MKSLSGIVRTAVVSPELRIGDVDFNVASTLQSAKRASKLGATLAVFPELGLTGYTLGDLVQQPILLQQAKNGLVELALASKGTHLAIVVGLPLSIENRLYNVAAVVADGQIIGLVPKTYLPNYQEFYEQRWYTSARDLRVNTVEIDGKMIPIGTDILFDFPQIDGLTLGIEICEDLWAPIPPSSTLAPRGATVIANLSASNELAGKAGYRRQLVANQSARLRAAYLYSSAGWGESTTDVVFGGHGMIADNGRMVAETTRFERQAQVITADIDLMHLAYDRLRTGTYELLADQTQGVLRHLEVNISPVQITKPTIPDRFPFVPAAGLARDDRTEEIFNLQSAALASRIAQTGIDQIVLGLSGGLDSTLAMLVAIRALRELNLPLTHLHILTLPGLATSDRTKSNAHALCTALGIEIEEIPIKEGSLKQLADVGHDETTQDITYENVQARYRTSILLARANQLHGFVLGTGDLSEIALGWATFNGDHISHYHVNSGVPKTLVKYLVSWAAEQTEFTSAREILLDIVDTPISPELTATATGELDQSTEDIIGPYELTDFFLYHFIRWGDEPAKILELAARAFGGDYAPAELEYWLKSFIKRFFGAQWKRSVMPDGPKVGSVALSPRGDWRMPSAISAKLWLDGLQ